jgi:formylglycine-generating enzyme required for sulfatase activity
LADAARLARYQRDSKIEPPTAPPQEEAEASYETKPACAKELFPAEAFWQLHSRESLHALHSRRSPAAEDNTLPAKLRQIRPLRERELQFSGSPPGRPPALPRTSQQPSLSGLVNAAAQFRPLPCRRERSTIAEASRQPVQKSAAAFAVDMLRAGQHSAWLEQFLLRLVRTWFDRKKDAELIAYARHVLELLPEAVCKQHDYPSFLYGIAYRDVLRQGAVILPQFRPEVVLAIAQEPLPPSAWLLIQEGEEIFLINSPEKGICLLKGSRLAALELNADMLLLHHDGRTETSPVQTQQPLFALPGAEHFSLQTPTEKLHIRTCTRPAWATLIGRNSRELFAAVPWLGRSCRLYWQASASGNEGQWKSCHGPVDTDRFGLSAYIGFYGKVMQRFRWLEPGRFWMGSPDNEPEREAWGKETLHEVRLSKGFWLADTAVTQELWQFVMRGDNPAQCKGHERPVENVTWHNVQHFLQRLNAMVPGLNARLPTEAEWEYACRAGSTTPFAFGSQITPEQVNYNGAFPYYSGVKGLFRRQTVPVKSLPANAWGLYEMHGNLWEWCQDWWLDDLGYDAARDPQGPENGEFRVVRGGSWFLGGKGVRSAVRGRFTPEFCNDRLGFRIARDHEAELESKLAVPAEDAPAPPASFLRRLFGRS